MAESTLWWLLAGAAVALELVTGTFYLLMLAVGLAAGALAAHLGASLTVQLCTAAIAGGLTVVLWQFWRRRHPAALPASANQDVNLDVGQTVQIDQWAADGTGHTRYRGSDWVVVLEFPSAARTPGLHRIVAVQGSHLVVRPV